MIGLLAPHLRDFAARVREALATFDLMSPLDGPALIRALAELGAFAQLVPATFGGDHAHPALAALCAIRHELGYRNPAADALFAAQLFGAHPLIELGEERLQQTLLPRLVRGAVTFAYALAETGRGDPNAFTTRAQRERDQYLLEGSKSRFVNGRDATHFLVFARTGEGDRALSAFVVPKGTPGLELETREAISDLPLVDVHFRNCRVSASCRLGPEGAGREIALSSLELFRVTDAAGAVGLASRAQEAAIEHAYARLHADAKLDALGPQHALLAEIRAELFAAAALVNRATHEPHREGAIAKLFATQAATRIVSRLAQLQSANGLEAGTVSERLQRAVRAPRNEDPAELYRAVLAPMLAPTR